MKKIENLLWEISNVQRGIVSLDKVFLNVSTFLVLGYCSEKNISDKLNLDVILKEHESKSNIEEALKIIGANVSELSDVIEFVSDLKLSNEEIVKILVILKSYSFSANEYRDAFEYMLKTKVESTGKSGGENTTPDFINKLAVEIIEPKNGEFLDGVFGIGGGAIKAYKFANSYGNELEIYGQELNSESYAIAKFRMFINGIDSSKIRHENTLTNPILKKSEDNLKKFDNIIMAPPFGMEWKFEEEQIRNDKYSRFMYGLPGKSSADWLFISTALKSLKETGKAAIITTLGALFRAGAEEVLRKKVLGFDFIESVIELPSGLFTNTAIPSAMIIFNMSKSEKRKNKIQFIDASDLYQNVRRGKNILSDENISSILDIYRNNKITEDISTIVDLKDIIDGNILPSRYVVKTEFESAEYGKVKIHLKNLKSSKTFADIGEYYRGINVTSKNVQDPNGNYKIINLADIKNGELDVDLLPRYSIENNARVEAYKVQAGDIIISNKGASKICIIPEHSGEVLISQNFIGIRLNAKYNAKYIKEFLQSPIGEYLIDSKKTGTSVALLNIKDLKEIPLVEMNNEEQNEIIDKYTRKEEVLREKLDEIYAKLERLKFNLYDEMSIGNLFDII